MEFKVGDILKYKYSGNWFKIKVIKLDGVRIKFETLEPLTAISFFNGNLNTDFPAGHVWIMPIKEVVNDNRYAKVKGVSHLPIWF